MRKAVFLDRDGVLNETTIQLGIPHPPEDVLQVKLIAGVPGAINLLKSNKFELVVVTNQPDVARGTSSKRSIEKINSFLGSELGINNFYTCFHDDNDVCDCRKPKGGLLLQAAADLNLDLESSFMVGDRWRDIAAGQSVGCFCYFIDYSYDEQQPNIPFKSVKSLWEAAESIVRNDCESSN